MAQVVRRTLPKFPESFRFGVATSDHQCEAFDNRYPDIRDVWDQARGMHGRGKATDFAVRYPEDIGLARDAGCKVFRFSVAWARVEPQPGVFNDEALAHYQRVTEAVCENGMQPMVTLHHFVWPLHIEHRGGMTAPGFPDWFAAYAAAVATAMGTVVNDWITLNEPNILCLGYFRPWWLGDYVFPPGLSAECGVADQVRAIGRLIPNLFQAHRLAREAIHKVNPKARVGANPAILGLPAWLQRFIDLTVARTGDLDRFVRGNRRQIRAGRSAQRTFLRSIAGRLQQFLEPISIATTAACTNWWHLGQAGQLPEFLCPRCCVATQDYVGFDYFWGLRNLRLGRIKNLANALVTGSYERASVWPTALHRILHYHSRIFPRLPIYIVEIGCVEVADGFDRAEFCKTHMEQVQSAIADGVNVDTLVVWSLTTNREWASTFGPGSDFGLYHVDLNGDPTLARRPTLALQTYKKIIADRSVSI